MIVIFDWDGTLCDSIGQIVSAMQAAAREVGLGTPSVQAVRDIVGLGLPQAIAILFPRCSQEARERVEVAYSKHFVAGDRGPATLFKGALATLDALRNRGFELAVATGKSRRGLSRVLAGLEGGTSQRRPTKSGDPASREPGHHAVREGVRIGDGDAEIVFVAGGR